MKGAGQKGCAKDSERPQELKAINMATEGLDETEEKRREHKTHMIMADAQRNVSQL